MKNKIKNLSWMLPILMCSTNVFAVFGTKRDYMKDYLTYIPFLIILVCIIARIIIFILNGVGIFKLEGKAKEEFKLNERKISDITKSRKKIKIISLIAGCVLICLAFVISAIKERLVSTSYGMSIRPVGIEIIDIYFTLLATIAYDVFIWIYHFKEKAKIKNILSSGYINSFLGKLTLRLRLGYTLTAFIISTIIFAYFNLVKITWFGV